MAAVDNLSQWETEVGSGVDSARVVLGAVMLTTVAVVALAANFFGPTLAAKIAAAMLPLLLVATLRAPLAGCSVYGSLTRRR